MGFIVDESLAYVHGDNRWPTEPIVLDGIALANQFGEEGCFLKAIAVLNLLIKHTSANPYLYYSFGHWQSMQANYSEAALAYARCLELDSLNPTAWCCYGYSLARLGRHHEAIHAYGLALQQHPGGGETYFLRSVSLFLAGDLKAALSDLDDGQALDATPQIKLIREVLDHGSACP